MNNNKHSAEKQTKYWIEHAKEDLASAKVMLKAGRYNWCAFICQQALEKLLKAGYVKKYKHIPPYIHKLERLVEILHLILPENLLNSLILIDKYYIVARYPSYKLSINIKSKNLAEGIYNNTKEIYKWLLKEMALK